MTMTTQYEVGLKNPDEEQQHVTVTADGLYDAFRLAEERRIGWESYQARNTETGVVYHLK